MKKIVVVTEFGSLIYNSISEAAKQTGISRFRIARALNSQYGIIKKTEPTVCVDYLLDDTSLDDKCVKCPYYILSKNVSNNIGDK